MPEVVKAWGGDNDLAQQERSSWRRNFVRTDPAPDTSISRPSNF